MTKKYISGENLIYILSKFEKKIVKIVEEGSGIVKDDLKASENDIKTIFV